MDDRRKIVTARVLDGVERGVVALLFAWFVYNILSDVIANGNLVSLVLLISETAVLIFVLLRRSTLDITRSKLDWALGFAGTIVPLVVLPAPGPILSPLLILAVTVAGAALQVTAKFFLRRSFGIVAANRGVKIGGPYRLIRHPMYAGYMLTQLGFLLSNPSSWNLAVYSLAWAAQLGRILVEERLLLQDQIYRDLATRVPYRLIPRLF
jgi:protein-S-isoprenylcysteine O-methyltransferase Ste14